MRRPLGLDIGDLWSFPITLLDTEGYRTGSIKGSFTLNRPGSA